MSEALTGLMDGFAAAITPTNLFWAFFGVTAGTLVGVLPGLGPPATIAILLPLSVNLDPATGLIMMAGIYYGAKYGGSTTSILLNIPGEDASVVTAIDGYQMARQGRAGPALGIAAIGSFIAGTLGLIALTFMAPLVAELADRLRTAGVREPHAARTEPRGAAGRPIEDQGRDLGSARISAVDHRARSLFGIDSLHDGPGRACPTGWSSWR